MRAVQSDSLGALPDTLQALLITAGLALWRIERELAALNALGGSGLIRLPDPDAPPARDRLRLTRVRRWTP